MGSNAATRPDLQCPTVRTAITEVDLCAWLVKAEPGDVLEYHVGLLAFDRTPLDKSMSAEERLALGQLADRAMQLANHGVVHLVQRRLGPGNFSYLAVARPWPKAIPASLSPLNLPEVA